MSTVPYPHFRSQLVDKWWGEGRAEGRAAGFAEGRADGRVEGAAEAVLGVLWARGLTVPTEIKSRVRSLTDLLGLQVLLVRAVAVERAQDLFAD